MTAIKSYTDLEQSKKLAEILPLESTDMKYISFRHRDDTIEWIPQLGTTSKYDIPCWSLSALLNVIPKIINNETLSIGTSDTLWHIGYMNIYFARTNNLIDACYELVLKLDEFKML